MTRDGGQATTHSGDAASPRSLTDVVSAADDLFEFLWNEKETNEPPPDLCDAGYAALESVEDYDKEERLTLALGRALGKEKFE